MLARILLVVSFLDTTLNWVVKMQSVVLQSVVLRVVLDIYMGGWCGT